MSGNRHALRDARGRFMAAAATGTELKRARGGRNSGRPQIRKRHWKALTNGEIERFLSCLAETCNVSAAARSAGRSARVFYDLRRRDAAFRTAWMAALREGYDHLEMELVRRARFGTPKDVFHHGLRTATTKVYADGISMRLLHLHRASVERLREADDGVRDPAVIFDELAARVAEMEAEEDRDGSD